MNAADQLVYKAILAAADARKPCPSNADLSDIAGFQRQQSAGVSLARIEKAGLIQIDRVSNGRTIRIIATGQRISTARYIAVERRYAQRRPAFPETLPPVVLRDPCPRCAVRADHGCAHGWTGEYFRVAA
ncbi:MAG: hypothetical protein JWR85_3572 [Marmoricola sp.]|nr:hypothetical protein [Marmoricola sp.]